MAPALFGHISFPLMNACSGLSDGTLWLWSMTSKDQAPRVMQGHARWVRSAALS